MTTTLNLPVGRAQLREGKKLAEDAPLRSDRAVGSVACQSTDTDLSSPLAFAEPEDKPRGEISDCVMAPLCPVSLVVLCCEPLLWFFVVIDCFFLFVGLFFPTLSEA